MRSLPRIALVCSLAFLLLVWNGCHQTPVKPYNLIISSDGGDPNGLMLNPEWGSQFSTGQPPTPLASPNEPWTSSQTDWNVASDSGLFCSGHENWMNPGANLRVGTFTGLLTWESHSGSWPFDDNDYSFNLVPATLLGVPTITGLQKNEDHIHVEYNFGEVGDQFGDGETAWWKAFRHAVDNSDARPTPFDMLTSRLAIVTGLFGMDTAHPPPNAQGGGSTEIHPIWGMAARVNDDPSDETYAFMARNWGDEGFCADGTQWTLNTNSLSILLPWRQGANSLQGWSGEFSIVNAPDSNLQNNVSVTRAGSSGVLLTFKLNQQPQDEPDEDGTVTEGEIHLQWNMGGVNVPTSGGKVATPKSEHREGDPEDIMRNLVAKMTPAQRTAFGSEASDRLPRKQVLHSVFKGSNSGASASGRPASPPPPTIGHIRSKRRIQREQARLDALHKIFGPTLPGVSEKDNKANTNR